MPFPALVRVRQVKCPTLLALNLVHDVVPTLQGIDPPVSNGYSMHFIPTEASRPAQRDVE